MGAEVTYEVRVLISIEATVEARGVTYAEAMENAEKMPGVIRVLDAPPRLRSPHTGGERQ